MGPYARSVHVPSYVIDFVGLLLAIILWVIG